MKNLSLPMVGVLGLMFILAVMAAAPQVAIADVERQDSQQGSLVVAAEPGGLAQPPASPGEVQERGLPPGVGPGLGGGRIAPPTAIPFKCSAATGKCRCYEQSDCDWMKSLLSGAGCKIAATCKANCECSINH
jgi:hypothetical protein